VDTPPPPTPPTPPTPSPLPSPRYVPMRRYMSDKQQIDSDKFYNYPVRQDLKNFAEMMINTALMDFYPYGIIFDMADEAVEIAEAKPRALEAVSKDNKVKGILGLTDSPSILYYLEKSEKLLE